MTRRGLIVARIKAGGEHDVARIFSESDSTTLPELAGVRQRSLFVLDDVYVHLVEFQGEADESVEGVRQHELFRDVSRKLEPFIRPYNPKTWRSPRDAFAREFYSWTAPNAVRVGQ
jgi:Polyketide synthesis cyclase